MVIAGKFTDRPVGGPSGILDISPVCVPVKCHRTAAGVREVLGPHAALPRPHQVCAGGGPLTTGIVAGTVLHTSATAPPTLPWWSPRRRRRWGILNGDESSLIAAADSGPGVAGSVKVLLVGLAGAAGALLRYGVVSTVGYRSLPWTVAGINVAGSFLLGLLLAVASHRGWPAAVTVPLSVGFLGSFTTFSTFSYDTQLMLREGRISAVLFYLALSVIGGILAAALGYAAADALL